MQPLELLESFTHTFSGPVRGLALAIASLMKNTVEYYIVESEVVFQEHKGGPCEKLKL